MPDLKGKHNLPPFTYAIFQRRPNEEGHVNKRALWETTMQEWQK